MIVYNKNIISLQQADRIYLTIMNVFLNLRFATTYY
jgi:hypothetical protein